MNVRRSTGIRSQSLELAGPWLRCALHAHTTGSDGELAPRALVKHYERAGYDVLAITDHWFRSAPPSTDRLLVIPSAELNCLLPDERDGHVLAFGIDGQARRARGRAPRSRRHRRVDHRARRRRVPRASVLDGRQLRHARAARHRRRASRSSTPAASSSSVVGSPPFTGTSCSTEAAAASRSRATTATTPASTRTSPGRGCRSERTAAGVLEALRSRLLLRQLRAADRLVVAGDGSVEVHCDPCQSVTGRLRRLERGSRQRGPPRLSLRRRDPRERRPTGSSRPPGSTCPRRRRTPGSRSPTRAAAEPGQTPCDPAAVARRCTCRAGTGAVRPARRRSRHRRRRHRERGGAGGAARSRSSIAATSAAPPRARRRS